MMTREDRNYYFEEKVHLINITMNKHRALIKACRMDDDDVYQELSIRLLDAIQKYDYAKCPNMDAYLTLQLRYKLLNMTACSKLTGVSNAPRRGFSILSLDAREADGYPVQAPVYEKSADILRLEKTIASLPTVQKNTVLRLLSGKRVAHNNRALHTARLRIRKSLSSFAEPQYA